MSCTVYLPAARVLPVQVKTVKIVLQDKLHNMLDELFPEKSRKKYSLYIKKLIFVVVQGLVPSCWVVDEPAVLVPLAVVPAADGHGHLDPVLFELCHLPVEVVVQVGPRVVRLHHQVGVVQHGKPVHLENR